MKSLLVLSVALFTLNFLPQRAHAWMQICNETDHSYIYSYVRRSGTGFLGGDWNAAGWFKLDNGCSSVHSTGVAVGAYLMIYRIVDGNYIPVEDVTRIIERRGTSTTVSSNPLMEASRDVFCLPTAGFKKTFRSSDFDRRSCRSDEFLAIATVYSFARGGTVSEIFLREGTVVHGWR
jgi:hypothetical protein